MEAQDSIPVLQVMECLDRMPVMEMEKVKTVGCIKASELVYHRDAHAVAVFDNVISGWLAIVIMNIFDCLIGNIPPREEMHFMVLVCQCSARCVAALASPPTRSAYIDSQQKKGYFK
jgi:hypothetical protein